MPEVICPKCGAPMVLRTARIGANARNQFYGCSRYPDCNGALPFKTSVIESVYEFVRIEGKFSEEFEKQKRYMDKS